DVLMPAPRTYSHRVQQAVSKARYDGLKDFGPDAQSHATLLYEDGRPVRASQVVVSTQQPEQLNADDVRKLVIPYIEASLPRGWMPSSENIYINPTGKFVIGGPDGDAGLTGRKIIVDTYGGAAPYGGGAFSGKDPTKVDRSAAYVAR